MRVIVTGANGQLGMDVCAAFAKNHDVQALSHEQLEITDTAQVERFFDSIRPQCVINTAAMHHVEKCEADPVQSYLVNAAGTKNLAEACARHDIQLIHISTDYVFDGAKKAPYLESDAPMPLNVYGNTKLSGEYYALTTWNKSSVVRVSGIYGTHPCRAKGGLNFVRLMLKLAQKRPQLRVVDDEILTPTPTAAIAEQLLRIAEAKAFGLFHATCHGQCSWYAFAERIFEIAGVKTDLQKSALGEFPAKVARPSYSVLENARLKLLGIDCMPHWEDGLKGYLAAIETIET